MRCQQCQKDNPRIVETRKVEGFCYRRRVCTCKNSWWTTELFCGVDTPKPVKDFWAAARRVRLCANQKRVKERREMKSALERAWFPRKAKT